MKSSPRNGFVPLQFSIFLAPKYSKDSFVRKPCCSSHRPLFPCVVCCHKLTSNLNNYMLVGQKKKNKVFLPPLPIK
ncbi:PsbP-like protein 1, chloroplastic [Galdieria sulphuraria]|nr:PsbP-like protein 1, chloroplastic [Galdieria sulphuraria]